MLSVMLPIRKRKIDTDSRELFPAELLIEEARGSNGLPLLRGELHTAAAAALAITLQISNGAGIPIIEGQALINPGERSFQFSDLRPIGIDAYAHKSAEERVQIAERIWKRRAFGTLQRKIT